MSAGILSVHARPGRSATLVLSWFLFASGIALYIYAATARHRENPEERVMPTLAQMAQGMYNAAMQPAEDDAASSEDAAQPPSAARRFLNSMLWKDTVATGRRFVYSMALLLPAVILGLHMGLFLCRGVLSPVHIVLRQDRGVVTSADLVHRVWNRRVVQIMLIVIGVTPTSAGYVQSDARGSS